MADDKPQELLIIKRVRGGSEGSHGGAWKIAFADFMTAMMALFLVLWLVSATNQRTKASIARYFNPVKLVDMTVRKRGLHDPQKSMPENASQNARHSVSEARPHKPKAKTLPVPAGRKSQSGAGGAGYLPTYSESALFRDPYAVLAQIAGTGPAPKLPHEKPAKGTQEAVQVAAGATTYEDPYQSDIPQVPRRRGAPAPRETAAKPAKPAPSAKALAASKPAVAAMATHPPAPSKVSAKPKHQAVQAARVQAANAPAAPKAKKEMAAQNPAPKAAKSAKVAIAHHQAEPQHKQKAVSAEISQASRLQKELAGILGKSKAAPHIDVTPTPKGILINLTDGYNYAMFAIGSAQPQRRTVQIMAKIGRVLKKEKGSIIIIGHTDGRRYKSRTYDNWRLSTARAQMALYMLVRGGLAESRIIKIEGTAAHDLKVPKDPLAAANRRIEILLRRPTP